MQCHLCGAYQGRWVLSEPMRMTSMGKAVGGAHCAALLRKILLPFG
jgi:hypothetical protein